MTYLKGFEGIAIRRTTEVASTNLHPALETLDLQCIDRTAQTIGYAVSGSKCHDTSWLVRNSCRHHAQPGRAAYWLGLAVISNA